MRAGPLSLLQVATFVVATLGLSVSATAIESTNRTEESDLNARASSNQSWKRTELYKGNNFYDKFNFFTQSDPTHGWVRYVGKDEARRLNLTRVDSGSFVIRGDHTKRLSATQKRPSVRISSKKLYTQHILIAKIKHMPTGRGTWPAFWAVGENNWPYSGELDIIEGVGGNGRNLQSLHTGPGCRMTNSNSRTNMHKGTVASNTCNAFENGNQGCGVRGDSTRDFGTAYNQAGGGYWAVIRTADTISTYFWSAKDKRVPPEVASGNATTVNPSTWGKRTAFFNSEACNLGKAFGKHTIVINLTFCGDWAGSVFPGGSAACNRFVRENPQEYDNAYWNIQHIAMYERK